MYKKSKRKERKGVTSKEQRGTDVVHTNSVTQVGHVDGDEAIKVNRKSGRKRITSTALKGYVWEIK